MMKDELTILDFLAQLINSQKAKQEGFITSTRWLCTKEDIQNECRAEAKRIFEHWKLEELEAEEYRQKYDKIIKK